MGYMIYPNGEKYIGQFSDNKLNGKGKYIKNGGVYYGEWLNDQRHGHGEEVWKNGDRYIGEYQHNKKHGKGKLIMKNGQTYVGQFENDKMNGIGSLQFDKSDSNYYKGHFLDNTMSGQGKRVTPEYTYEGQFLNNKPNGQGKIIYRKSKLIYQGAFANGKKSGQGILIDVSTGQQVTQNWSNGVLKLSESVRDLAAPNNSSSSLFGKNAGSDLANNA